MGKRNDLTPAEKQKIANLLSAGMSTLEISKELCLDPQIIKKDVENMTKLGT